MSRKFSWALTAVFMTTMAFQSLFAQQKTHISLGGGISKAAGTGSEYWQLGGCIFGEAYTKISKHLWIGGRIAANRWSPDEDKITELYTGGDTNPVGPPSPEPIAAGHMVTSTKTSAEAAASGIDVSGYASIVELVPAIRVIPSSSATQKYRLFGQLGCGLFLLKQKAEVTENGTTSTEIDFSDQNIGISFGGGIAIATGRKLAILLYPICNLIFTENESTKYYSVNLGIQF